MEAGFFSRRICRYRSTRTVVLPAPGPAVTEMCRSSVSAARACAGSNSLFLPSTSGTMHRTPFMLFFPSTLPTNPVLVITTDGRVVAKPAGLLALRWSDAKVTCTHAIKKLPDLLDYFSAYLVPFGICQN